MILRPPSISRSTSGAALLAVLWVVTLLITLVAATALLITQDVDAAASKRQIFRSRMLAETALAIAMNPDVQPDEPLLRRQFSDDERYEVHMTGEDGLINPNMLLQREDRETFRRIFRNWGLSLPQCDAVIDCLLDWVDGDDFKHINGAESKAYGNNGMPFNRPFRSVEEMGMVRGMELVEKAYPEWRSWFSVYASGQLDISEAKPEIVSLFTGADMGRTQNLQKQFAGFDGIRYTEDDPPEGSIGLEQALNILGIPTTSAAQLSSILSVTSPTKRIVVRVQVGDLKREVAAVIRGAIGKGATTILFLQESNPSESENGR
ncbi:general secretion pathway protein GspK [Brevifollis gellanilyticus]|uniref:general secretion pathway protein GspK n=1 Tax=Brevifollis gellanilyticus TaxID=748831 RepID=UPI0011BFB069|nr:type II secretion system protein GspK [Brevifollis gellanilyticus]